MSILELLRVTNLMACGMRWDSVLTPDLQPVLLLLAADKHNVGVGMASN